MNGVEIIAAERKRQIEEEGWTAKHDELNSFGELSMAACCYAYHASIAACGKDCEQSDAVPAKWPWEGLWWKPSNDALRDLAKAGALIAAEIDRLQRLRGESDG